MASVVNERVSDADLIRLVRAGSMDALGELYARHADDVYSTALRLLGVPADAEDVLHDVFVGLVNALRRYDERGAFGGWLRQVTVRTALMALRRRTPRALGRAVSLDSVTVAAPDPVETVAAESAVAALPDQLRAVFVLREVEGYTHNEIGALLGISPNAAALRLHRAWKLLRERVQP